MQSTTDSRASQNPALRAIYNNLKPPEKKKMVVHGVAEEPATYNVASDTLLKVALNIDKTTLG